MVDEARLEDTGAGLEPASEGWFVVNVADAAWLTNEAFGAACIFETEDTQTRDWDVGFTLGVVWPGRPSRRPSSRASHDLPAPPGPMIATRCIGGP